MLTPYYDRNGITLYLGDCREVLPQITEKVDLCLTDPPYGVNINYAAYDDTPENLQQLINDTLPMLPRPLVLTTGVKNIWLYPKPDWVLCWFMPNGVGVGPWGFCTWQPILAYGKDPWGGKGSRPDGIERLSAPSDKNNHPCPKPVSVMRWLIERCTTAPGQVVLDPFMGSGTTLRAALDCGRRAIGIDISEEYLKIAVERLRQEVLL